MGTHKTARFFGLLLTLLSMATRLNAHGELMIYTLSAVGSGGLGTNTFENTPFTITSIADTTNIAVYGSFFEVANIEATVAISGLGSATIWYPVTVTFANGYTSAVGMNSPYSEADFLDDFGPAARTYDLSHPFGPIRGRPVVNSGNVYPTSLAGLEIVSVSSVTFQARWAEKAPDESLDDVEGPQDEEVSGSENDAQ